MLNGLAIIATTIRRAGIPIRSRYRRSAWAGWIFPYQVSLSVYTTNTSTGSLRSSA